MLRDAATRHKPVAIVTDLREDAQLTRPAQKDLSQVRGEQNFEACA